MTPEEIVVKVAHFLDTFDPIVGKPSDSDLTRLQEAVNPLLLQIPYDKTGAVHNLIGPIWPEATYVARYREAFPEPTRVGEYEKTIDNESTAIVRARTEAAHKVNRADHAKYETARRETTQFFLAVVADTWVIEHGYSETIYKEVAPKDLLSHLQSGCTLRHALNLLPLQNEMQRYHLEVEGIPEYINMLEDSQRQAG